MERQTELALVRRLREDDAEAFEVVHAEFNARLFTFLLRLSRRRDVAEDLLEETWLRLVANARRLQPDTRFGPWLYTVARNLYLSYCRSRLIGDSDTAGLVSLWPFSPERPSPFEEAAASELQRRVERALGALSPTSREVLLLVAVEGLDISDAADVCGISPDALRQRLSRARAQLARLLDENAANKEATVLGDVIP